MLADKETAQSKANVKNKPIVAVVGLGRSYSSKLIQVMRKQEGIKNGKS